MAFSVDELDEMLTLLKRHGVQSASINGKGVISVTFGPNAVEPEAPTFDEQLARAQEKIRQARGDVTPRDMKFPGSH